MATITDTRLQGLTAAEWGDVWPRMLRENARRQALAPQDPTTAGPGAFTAGWTQTT